jgi:hypothetical protein
MGKKTIRTLLKNDKDASGMINSIENVSKLPDFLTLFRLKEK